MLDDLRRPLAPARPLADLIDKYDGRAPRYTSYPTAVQFTPQVDAAVYAGWLAALPAGEPVSLYLHIPFCARLCWYCGCNTRAVNRREPISDYVKLLIKDFGLVAGALAGPLPAAAVHLGGGTPNMLSPEEMDALFDALAVHFPSTDGLEIAAELDPAVLTRDWVQAAARRGLNRASLGVQSLSPHVQRAVNRDDTIEQISDGMGWLREAGVASINLDLMYGLPNQTTADTLETLDQVLRLRPDRLALFGYAHVPWMKTHQKLIREAELPGAHARLDQSEAAAERLIEAGYVRIGLDHFALETDSMTAALRAGTLHRNFQGYTTDEASTLIGMGASAIGALPQGFVQNQSQELAWRAAVSEGRLPVVRGVPLTADDRYRAEIIERLMCDLQVDLAAVSARHDRSAAALAPEKARLRDFEADGLVEIAGDTIRVTEQGRLLVRSVSAVFDAYFSVAAGRHSKAI